MGAAALETKISPSLVGDVIDLFVRREDAEAMVAAWDRDEPADAGALEVVEVKLPRPSPIQAKKETAPTVAVSPFLPSAEYGRSLVPAPAGSVLRRRARRQRQELELPLPAALPAVETVVIRATKRPRFRGLSDRDGEIRTPDLLTPSQAR